MKQPAHAVRLLDLAFLASGLAALGYELLWTRLLGLALGSEMLAVMGVLAGFFGGMALGSALLHGPVRRSRRPARLFALFELIAAAYALLGPWLLPALTRLFAAALPAQNGAARSALILLLAGILLLPATLPMGATLAALVEARRRARHEAAGRGIGRLYALNTTGAALGVLLSAHLLQPHLGFVGAAVALALCGALAALLALLSERDESPAAETGSGPTPPAGWTELVLLLLTGLAGIALEVLGIRVLAQVLKGTVYTFANVLTVYLLGTAAGAALYGRFLAPRLERGRGGLFPLAIAMLAAAALSGLVMSRADLMLDRLVVPTAPALRWFLAEAMIAIAVFLPATLTMGALFTRLLAGFRERGVGRPYALNTLGALAAPFLAGPLVIAQFGYRAALLGTLALYGLIALIAAALTRRRALAWGASALLILAVLGGAPRSLVLVEAARGWRLLELRESLYGTVLVTEASRHQPALPSTRRLRVGRHYAMGGGLSFGERRMGHLPLLLRPEANDVLFLGVGTGATLGALAEHTAQRAVGVELLPAVLDLMPHFETVNEGIWADPRVELRSADARRALAETGPGERFDLVVADLFHPARDGAGFLYTREHFAAGREALKPGGTFAQWLPLYQLDAESLRLILRSFLAEFPATRAWLGLYTAGQPNLLLMGQRGGEADVILSTEMLQTRMGPGKAAARFVAGGVDLLGGHLCAGESLSAWAGAGPLNRDLFPRLLFAAPAANYPADPRRGARLLDQLLPLREPYPAGLIGGPAPACDSLHAAALRYGEALALFLSADVERVLRDPAGNATDRELEGYRRALERDPAFSPARGALLRAAAADPRRAPALYEAMLRILPRDTALLQGYRDALKRSGRPERFGEFLRELMSQRP